jgi:predicted enzyme related to lactoylglutathione lyase
MFSGLRTVIYKVTDIEKARDWYSLLLGFKPYFDEAFYVGFNVAGYELGLQPVENLSDNISTRTITYWGVEKIEEAFARIQSHGAIVVESIQDVGDGIKVATLADPFGNVVGIIENPHFKLD